MKTDIRISREAHLKPISEVAAECGFLISLEAQKRLKASPDGS